LIDSALDRRAASEIGRSARLELVFSRRRGHTILSHSYAEPPFRTGQPAASGDRARMILASSAPGIFGGDCLEQRIRVERGSSVSLASQSALQAHPAPDGRCATLQTTIDVEEEAALRCEWDALIPFPAARFSQKIAINLAAGAALYWSDAFMAGREGRGERWAFETLGHELAPRRGGSLVFLERFRLEPAVQMLESRWVASDSCYFGTVLAVGVQAEADKLHDDLSRFEGVRAAVESLDADMTLVRLMAQRGTAFHDARALVCRCLRA
jgi:urease accessory protein UreH